MNADVVRLATPTCLRPEVAGGDDHHFLRIEVLAEGLGYLVGGQRFEFLFELGLVSHRAAAMEHATKRCDKPGIAAAANLLRLEVSLLRVGQFFRGDAPLAQL